MVATLAAPAEGLTQQETQALLLSRLGYNAPQIAAGLRLGREQAAEVLRSARAKAGPHHTANTVLRKRDPDPEPAPMVSRRFAVPAAPVPEVRARRLDAPAPKSPAPARPRPAPRRAAEPVTLISAILEVDQVDILQGLANGRSLKEMGQRLGRTRTPVYQRLRAAREALGAETTHQAVAAALRMGLIA